MTDELSAIHIGMIAAALSVTFPVADALLIAGAGRSSAGFVFGGSPAEIFSWASGADASTSLSSAGRPMAAARRLRGRKESREGVCEGWGGRL